MLRSSLIAAGAALLCGTSLAQSKLDPSLLRPVTSPPQHAGTYNVTTHRWVGSQRPMARNLPLPYAVFDNTCTWSGGGFYLAFGVCNDTVDEGRIPGGIGDTGAPFGATADNLINTVVFTYCVDNAAAPGLELDFFDGLGGGCLGGVPALPTGLGPPPPPFSPWVTVPGLAGAFSIPGGVLPGDPGVPGDGFAACYIVTATFGNGGFCMQSNADGTFDNSSLTDNFNWVWQLTTPGVFPFDGILLSGETANGAGSCTYTIPCSADLYYTSTVIPCGHGLDTQDLFWINIDGVNTNGAGPGPGCPPYGTLFPFGSGCYWFGGHPGNPFASYYLRLESLGSCAGCDGAVTEMCEPTAPDVTEGCTPDASWVGTPDVAQCNTVGPSDFVVTFGSMRDGAGGLAPLGDVVIAHQKPSTLPWSAQSVRCFAFGPTMTRTGQQTLVDTNGAAACGGSLVLDVEAYLQGGNPNVAPASAGDCYVVQGWYRDPNSAKTTQLTDAVAFYVCP
jgi:hypothetical protein